MKSKWLIGFPYIVVNSEKYIFSPNVLKAGKQLYYHFSTLRNFIRDLYNRYFSNFIMQTNNRFCEDEFHADVKYLLPELAQALEQFDQHWAKFEKVLSF